MNLHIHAPRGETQRRHSHCPTCNRTTRFVVIVYEWYDPDSICCECGDSWQGAEMTQRPFERGWRKRSMAYAEQLWEAAGYCGPVNVDANGAPVEAA